MISTYEKMDFMESAEAFVDGITNHKQAIMLVKIIFDLHERTDDGGVITFEEDDLESLKKTKELLLVLLQHPLEKASEMDKYTGEIMYTSKELARYFGVSHQTINKWLSSGRFKGIEKERNKHAKISECVIWIDSDGTEMQVKEVVEMYQLTVNQTMKQRDCSEIEKTINNLESKYGGMFEHVFLPRVRQGDKLSSEEEEDFFVWEVLKRQLVEYEEKQQSMV